jgi:hypothetical protein
VNVECCRFFLCYWSPAECIKASCAGLLLSTLCGNTALSKRVLCIKLIGTFVSGRVLDGSALPLHVTSWANRLHSLALRSLSVCLSVCLPASLSLSTPLSYTSDLHEQRLPNSGRFCASTVTCPREPVNFSRLLCTLSLSALYPPSFLHYCHHISCCHTSVYLYELFPILMAEVGIKPIPRLMPKSYPNDQKIENKNSNTCQCNGILSFENRARTNSRNVICTSYISFKFRVF